MTSQPGSTADLWGMVSSSASDRSSGSTGRAQGLGEALAAAFRRVRSDRASWRRYAVDDSEVDGALEHLHATLVPGSTTELERGERAGEIALQRRLLELLRRELLQGAEGVNETDLLQLLSRIETITGQLEPDLHQSMANELMGVSSRDLVVELAHDLRSPLTSIMFLADTLRKGQSGEINDIQRQQVGIIYSASLSLVSVASDLIDLSQDGDFVSGHVEPEPFSLKETFDSVRAMVNPMAHEKHLHLQFYTPDKDVRLGSPSRLNRVILNLAANALKFTDEGRVEVVALERGPTCVEFSVRDTGPGMDQEDLAMLYEPFHRGEGRTGFHFSGTGLGLSICRRLVGVMGGELQVESRRGYGSRFFFELELPRVARE